MRNLRFRKVTELWSVLRLRLPCLEASVKSIAVVSTSSLRQKQCTLIFSKGLVPTRSTNGTETQ